MEQLLTLDFLVSKRDQAQKDVEIYSIMIQEIEELSKKNTTNSTKSKFLSVFINKELIAKE